MSRLQSSVLWSTVVLYLVGRLCQLEADHLPSLLIVLLHVAPPAAFAVLHGSIRYRMAGMLAFASFCLGVGAASESLSLRTGFPFGHYAFTDVMGPKAFDLPVLLVLAYLGIGYVSWTLAVTILGVQEKALVGVKVLAAPLLASLIMVAWDLSMEATWSTVDRAWVWRDGGAYFGVPISNFAGWYLTSFLFYLCFAAYLRRRLKSAATPSVSFWRLPILMYAICATGNLLLLRFSNAASVVVDGSGKSWRTQDVLAVGALMSVVVMGSFAVVAWLCTCEKRGGSVPLRAGWGRRSRAENRRARQWTSIDKREGTSYSASAGARLLMFSRSQQNLMQVSGGSMLRRPFIKAALGTGLLSMNPLMRAASGFAVPAASFPPMALGLVIKPGDQPEAVIARVKQLGLPTCFLSLDEYLGKFTSGRAQELRGLLEKYGVTATAAEVVGPGTLTWDFADGPSTIGIVPRATRAARVDALKQTADFAKLLGVVNVQTHCGFIPEDPRDPLYEEAVLTIRSLAQHCKGNGQFFLMETGQETPTTMLRTIKDVDQPNLGVGLDTANLILYGKANPVDAVDILGTHVRSIHAKDGRWPTDPMQLGEEVVIGKGRVDFGQVLAKLHALGYPGAVSIERETSGPSQIEDVKLEKLYLERILKQVQSGSQAGGA